MEKRKIKNKTRDHSPSRSSLELNDSTNEGEGPVLYQEIEELINNFACKPQLSPSSSVNQDSSILEYTKEKIKIVKNEIVQKDTYTQMTPVKSDDQEPSSESHTLSDLQGVDPFSSDYSTSATKKEDKKDINYKTVKFLPEESSGILYQPDGNINCMSCHCHQSNKLYQEPPRETINRY